MASVWGEFRRRKIIQVAAAYVVVAWLMIQVITSIADPLEFPAWAESFVIVLLALGFPITVIMSWAFNMTPEGFVRDQGEGTPTIGGGRSIEHFLIGLLVIAVGWLLYRDAGPQPGEEPVANAVPVAEVLVSDPRPGSLPNSIAVLPFENMSANPEDAFFAAGVHDEILNQLAKLQDLNVMARTSVMQYAGVARPIIEIAGELNVETIMEGSVSYADGRVAVRAQLIDAETGVHLWSEGYNRGLADIFAIQGDIARNIADALEIEFSLAEQAAIESAPTGIPEAYTLYLRAITSATDPASAEFASLSWAEDLDRAVELDPTFAVAYATKAIIYAFNLRLIPDTELAARSEPIAREAALEALRLDPTLGTAHTALGILYESAGDLDAALAEHATAYELSSRSPEVLEQYARFFRNRGDFERAIQIAEELASAAPLQANSYHHIGIPNRYAGNYDAAAEAFQRAIALEYSQQSWHTGLAYTEIARRNNEVALEELRISESLGATNAIYRVPQMAYAYSMIGEDAQARRLYDEFVERVTGAEVGQGLWAMAHLAMRDYDRAFESLELAVEAPTAPDTIPLAELKANAYEDPALEEARFRALRERIGR